MAILDVFKKKEEKGIKNDKFSEKEKVKEKKTALKTDIFKKPVLKSNYITEKSTVLEKENRYIFKVSKDSNKTEIKKDIEKRYKVNALSVKVINVKRKKRRVGKYQGWKKGYKKAIVHIKEGQKIDLA